MNTFTVLVININYLFQVMYVLSSGIYNVITTFIGIYVHQVFVKQLL